MSGRAISILFFGIYLILSGALLFLFPNYLLGLMGIPKTSEAWIRIVGVLCVNIGFFNVMATHVNYTEFFKWMVVARVLFSISIVVLVVLKFANKSFLLFAVEDLMGAIWTILSSDQKSNPIQVRL